MIVITLKYLTRLNGIREGNACQNTASQPYNVVYIVLLLTVYRKPYRDRKRPEYCSL